MEKGTWVVMTHPTSAAEEDQFNKWYDEIHLPDLLNIPGVVGATRFRRDSDETEMSPYLALYELEAESLKDVLDEVVKRAGTPLMEMSDALSMSEETGPRTVLFRKI
ncbi:MAG: hypothetical protein JWP10_1888 [Nocardioidaceae bacterium]|nr:hypothetical protein [Nocardioidaceae bacterium]